MINTSIVIEKHITVKGDGGVRGALVSAAAPLHGRGEDAGDEAAAPGGGWAAAAAAKVATTATAGRQEGAASNDRQIVTGGHQRPSASWNRGHRGQLKPGCCVVKQQQQQRQ